MLLSYGSYENFAVIGARMKAALSMEGIPGLISLMYAELEQNHGKKLVSTLLGLLTLAVEGISEKEAEDLLTTMDDVLDGVFEWWQPPFRRIPLMLVHRVIDDLGKYLIQRRSESGTMVYSWYHRQFWETAKRRYLSDPAVREKLHGVLSTYFTNSIPSSLEHDKRKDIWGLLFFISHASFYFSACFTRFISGQVSPQPLVLNSASVWEDTVNCKVNRRRTVEGSYHLLHAGKDFFHHAINELCDVDNICAYIIAG